jgi:hypothetical protein
MLYIISTKKSSLKDCRDVVPTADASDRQWGSTYRCQTQYFLDNHAALSGC